MHLLLLLHYCCCCCIFPSNWTLLSGPEKEMRNSSHSQLRNWNIPLKKTREVASLLWRNFTSSFHSWHCLLIGGGNWKLLLYTVVVFRRGTKIRFPFLSISSISEPGFTLNSLPEKRGESNMEASLWLWWILEASSERGRENWRGWESP